MAKRQEPKVTSYNFRFLIIPEGTARKVTIDIEGKGVTEAEALEKAVSEAKEKYSDAFVEYSGFFTINLEDKEDVN